LPSRGGQASVGGQLDGRSRPLAGGQQGGARQPAGIRDVARLAGVSVASVSFALNGQPGVADDTRRRILAAADQLGYRANPQAQALRRGRTTTYGLVIRNFSNPFSWRC
jgi:LacI family transcriptional regulator